MSWQGDGVRWGMNPPNPRSGGCFAGEGCEDEKALAHTKRRILRVMALWSIICRSVLKMDAQS